jgi:hypothetical protein
MIETILLARERKSGKQVVLMGSETEFQAQKDKLHTFGPDVNDEYDRVGLYQLAAQKKVLKLVTTAEFKAAADTTTRNNKIQADAEAELQKKLQKKVPSKKI